MASSSTRATSSLIWEHFQRSPPPEQGGTTAGKCNICNAKMTISKGNTSSMRKHLEKMHPVAFSKLKDAETEAKARRNKTAGEQNQLMRQTNLQQYVAATGAFGVTTWKTNDARTKSGNSAVLAYIARDMRPLSVVDQPGFWSLISHFQPCYPIPSRTTVRGLIKPEVDKIERAIKAELKDIQFVSFTTDIWTDSATTNYSYISLTGHWINTDQRDGKCV